jgi:hypothetical protein
MTTPALVRTASYLGASLTVGSLVGCQLIIGLDDYYLAPDCPPNAARCTVCNTPADCGPADACHTWSCVEHLCQPVDAKAGSPCKDGVCSDASPSTCVACNQDKDCPSGAYCDEHACYRCDDGVQNGDEWDVDCGGHCLTCPGLFCKSGAECTTGFCAPEGRCSFAPCDQPCAYVKTDGDCSAIAKYETDWAPRCPDNLVCNGGGGCGLPNGYLCVSAVKCASFKCECANPECKWKECVP